MISCLMAGLTPVLAVSGAAGLNDVEPAGTARKAAPAGLPSVDDGLDLYYVANNGTDALLITTATSSGWTGDTPVGDHSSVTTPAVLGGTYQYIFFVGSDGQNELNVASSFDGITWGSKYVIPGVKSKFAPAAAGYFGYAIVAYVADDGTDDLYIVETRLPDAGAVPASELKWDAPVKITGQKSRTAPALNVFMNEAGNTELVLAYVADNTTNDLLITTSAGGDLWTKPTLVKGPQDETPQQSPLAPALLFYYTCSENAVGCPLLLGYVANNGSNDLFVTTSHDALNWTKSSPVQGQQSSVAPALGIAPSLHADPAVIMAFVANNGSHDLLVVTSSDGTHWSGSSPVGKTSKAAPAMSSVFPD